MCEKILQITPTFTLWSSRAYSTGQALPPQGGGNFFFISICFPSPLAGEGRVRGYVLIFSHLRGEESVRGIF